MKRRTFIAALTASPLIALTQAQAQYQDGNREWPAERTGGKRVLLTGLDPAVVDYSLFPGFDAEKLRAVLEAQLQELIGLGYTAQWCFIDTSSNAENKVIEVLKTARFDAVLIGAGVRTTPATFLLFERMVNALHRYAFGARIVFNQGPTDTAASIQRWV